MLKSLWLEFQPAGSGAIPPSSAEYTNPQQKSRPWYSPLGCSPAPRIKLRPGLDRSTLLYLLTWCLLCTATGAAQAINTLPNGCSLSERRLGHEFLYFRSRPREWQTQCKLSHISLLLSVTV